MSNKKFSDASVSLKVAICYHGFCRCLLTQLIYHVGLPRAASIAREKMLPLVLSGLIMIGMLCQLIIHHLHTFEGL